MSGARHAHRAKKTKIGRFSTRLDEGLPARTSEGDQLTRARPSALRRVWIQYSSVRSDRYAPASMTPVTLPRATCIDCEDHPRVVTG